MTSCMRLAAAAVLTVAFASNGAAQLNQWSDRTRLTFDSPVMIPGATLPPGTYVFKLVDSPVSRHLVQIMNEDETKLMATTQAIPTRRTDVKGDVVVKMNPTEAGAPVALKAWFYPGSAYGHEFVYPEEQARQIAQRTKTLVLSTDVPGTDTQKGTLHTYDAEGRRGEWKEDGVTMKEWNAWRQGRQATAKVAAPGTPETRAATAPAVRSDPAAMKVRVSDLEENSAKYTGQTISVTGEVEEVFGPRLFKIDEPGWADLDREVLVYVPSSFAALVREDDAVTVTGTVRMITHPEIEGDLAWLEPGADSVVTFLKRPVLMASRIVGGNNNVALAIEVSGTQSTGDRSAGASSSTGTTGTTGTTRAGGDAAGTGTSGKAGNASSGAGTGSTTAGRAAGPALSEPSALASAGRDLVGRQVDLDRVKVVRLEKEHGFWIESGGHSLLVLPASGQKSNATAGQAVSIDGVLLEMPRRMREKARAAENGNDRVYIYATTIRKTAGENP